MRTTALLSFVTLVAVSAGCASAPRAQTVTATVPRCAVAAVVTQPEEVARDPRAHDQGEAQVVAETPDAARGQAPASATAQGVVAYQDASVTRGNGPTPACAYEHGSAQRAGVPRS
jgi:hypothetical protein